MENTSLPTGDTGSAPGTLAPADWKKWGMAAVYLIGSTAIVAVLNGILELLARIDFASWTLMLPLGLEVKGGMIGLVLTNLVVYLITLITKDSRK